MCLDMAKMRKFREARGSQQAVAAALGVDERSYRKWESGRTHPDGFNMLRLLLYLEIEDVQWVAKDIEFDGSPEWDTWQDTACTEAGVVTSITPAVDESQIALALPPQTAALERTSH